MQTKRYRLRCKEVRFEQAEPDVKSQNQPPDQKQTTATNFERLVQSELRHTVMPDIENDKGVA